jgi:hypothetical protein
LTAGARLSAFGATGALCSKDAAFDQVNNATIDGQLVAAGPEGATYPLGIHFEASGDEVITVWAHPSDLPTLIPPE